MSILNRRKPSRRMRKILTELEAEKQPTVNLDEMTDEEWLRDAQQYAFTNRAGQVWDYEEFTTERAPITKATYVKVFVFSSLLIVLIIIISPYVAATG